MSSGIVRIDSRIGRLPLHNVAATRRIEAARLATMVPFALMQAAGTAVARLALALVPHASRTIVFAGAGNNGGDGIEAASYLHQLRRDVSVVLLAEAERLPADAARALARARAAGVRFIDPSGFDPQAGKAPQLVIDALLGIGATRPAEGALARAIEQIAASALLGAHVLAVDVPSGLDVDHGTPFGDACVRAHDTLTLLTLKPGLFTSQGGDATGRVWFADLREGDGGSLTPDDEESAEAWLVGAADSASHVASRRPSQHKGSFGDVAVVGGAPGMRGAAWLAGRAAQAAGCGRVFIDLIGSGDMGSSEDLSRPELMLRRGWAEGDLAALRRAVAVCGCGGGDAVRASLPRLLSACSRLVLDADALNAVAHDESLQALLAARAGRGLATVLTPHPLEAARLLGLDTAAIQADRLGHAQALADRFACVTVVKGAGTVIAAPGQRPRINVTGNASLASAGTGDVLAGWLGGRWAIEGDRAPASAAEMLAAAFDAATRSVIEHGLAAEPERPGALRAGDLVETLHRNSRTADPGRAKANGVDA